MLQVPGTPKAIANRVLVVEDDLPLLELIGDYVQRELNCEVHCAVDREEAEALLDSYKYSLVIADLSLTHERFEGLDLIEQVPDAHGRPRIVAMSGQGADCMEKLALNAGADLFVEKPQPLSELGATLRQLINATSPAFPKPLTGRLLQQLLGDGGIVPVVQPIFKLDGNSHSVYAVECLSRGPAGTPFELADALFAYARRKRAEHIVDQHCITAALKAASAIPAQVRIAVNVHATTLGRCSDFCGWLCTVAAENSIDTRRLTVEIVEHLAEWNNAEFFREIGALRAAGIRIALDDIGLGRSTFRMLVDAKPDYMKLDHYFVHGCHRDKARKAVVVSVATLAAELGSSVIAEGVDDAADLQILRDAGIALVQGFLFCPPIPLDRLPAPLEPEGFCACSLEPRTDPSQCPLKGLGLCSRMSGQADEDGKQSRVPSSPVNKTPGSIVTLR